MRRVLKIVGYLFLAIVVLVLSALAYLYIALPKKEPPSTDKIEATPERLKRGEYLVRHVSSCLHCHSAQDKKAFAYPIIPGTEGQGGESIEDPAVGKVIAPNITPAALKVWTDGEIGRAITGGITKDGSPLFPMMPYPEYARLTQEDVKSIVAYLRTLKPIAHQVERSQLKFPLNLIVRTIPKPAHPPASVSNQGEYLARIAGCAFCHTPTERGKPIDSKRFAGGNEFQLPGRLSIQSSNITPDDDTGIGKWSKELFISKFRRFNTPETSNIPVPEGQPNTVMPWVSLSGLTDEDLSAIYDYLSTIPAVRSRVKPLAVGTT